jgi:hypothetical protein
MPSFNPLQFVLISVAGWMNQRQLEMIEYLREENAFFMSSLATGVSGSAMLSGADWPPRRKESVGSF